MMRNTSNEALGAVGVFAQTKEIIPDFICDNTVDAHVHDTS